MRGRSVRAPMGAGDAPGYDEGGPVRAAPGAPAPGEADRGARPDGVSILAVLAFITAVALLGFGAAIATVAHIFIPPDVPVGPALLTVVGGLLVLLGVAYLLTGWGLWTGRDWAWPLSLILAILALFAFPIGTIAGALVLYYLTRPPVKRFFGQV